MLNYAVAIDTVNEKIFLIVRSMYMYTLDRAIAIYNVADCGRTNLLIAYSSARSKYRIGFMRIVYISSIRNS